MIGIHEFPSGLLCFFFSRTYVDMNLGTGSAGTLVAHFPEIVLFVSVDNMIFRNDLLP